MVLEALTNPVAAEKRPAQMMLLGFLYASAAVFFSLWIFYEYSSLVMVFLTVFASVPIVYNTIRLEEHKDETVESERMLLKEHGKALEVFLFLFIGYAVAFAIWYLIMPSVLPAINYVIPVPDDAHQVLFSTQKDTYYAINARVIGWYAQLSRFTEILANNLNVLMFCILFSFIYGLGAIFILAWNASVIGTAIGIYIQDKWAALASGSGGFIDYVGVFLIGFFLKYSIHGLMEIAAYFVGGLAGGIISIAVMKHHFNTKKFEHILWDTSDLIILSVVILVVAAVVEVWVTPLMF